MTSLFDPITLGASRGTESNHDGVPHPWPAGYTDYPALIA
jgi:hypothetical protein